MERPIRALYLLFTTTQRGHIYYLIKWSYMYCLLGGKEPYSWKIQSPTFTCKKSLLNVCATLFKIGMQHGASATGILLHSILMLPYLIYLKLFCGSRLTFECMYGSLEHFTRTFSWRKFSKACLLLNYPIQNDYRADCENFYLARCTCTRTQGAAGQTLCAPPGKFSKVSCAVISFS